MHPEEEEKFAEENTEMSSRSEVERCATVRVVIQRIAGELGVKLTTTKLTVLQNMNLMQLQKELGMWNVRKREMIKAKNKAPKSNNLHHGTTSSNKLVYSTSGLNAEAVSTPVEKKVRIQKDKPPEVEAVQKKQQRAPTQVRHSYTVRLKLQMQDRHVNVSQKLKEIFTVWKTADPSTILLAHANEENSNLMIDDVNKIPYDEAEVMKYVMGLYQYNGKLNFSLRLSGHQNLRNLKIKVFQWMRVNNSFASIDKVKAALVHTIGFFHSMHPDYYNREQFKTSIKKYLEPINIGDDVNVFARKTWMTHQGKKIETRALVLEVPKEAKDSINEMMLEFEYGNCPNMTYIPFANMQDENHQEIMKEVYFSQNVYLHKMDRRTIYGISNPTKQYTLLNGDTMSFQDWISTITYGDTTFLEACEIGPNGDLHLIYNAEHEQTVRKLFGNDFKLLALQHFQPDDVKELFKRNKVNVEYNNKPMLSGATSEYLAFLKRKFSGNQTPKSLMASQVVTKGKTYAEISREPPMKMNKLNLHYSSFSPAPPPTSAQNLQIAQTLQQVLKRVESLEKKPQQQPVVGGKVSNSTLEDRLQKKLSDMNSKFDIKLKEMETISNQRMIDSENMILEKFEQMQMAHSNDIKQTFDTKMDQMHSTFALFMNRLETKLASTGAGDATESVPVPGKNE